jgi:hypothetical protein
MRRRGATISGILFLVIFIVYAAAGMEFTGWGEFSSASMSNVNAQIALYGEDHHVPVGEIHSTWGIGLGASFPFSVFGVKPGIYGRALLATGGGAEETPVDASALGIAAGGTFEMGAWSARADIGLYHGAFSFARAGYDGLGGLGVGANATVAYRMALPAGFSLSVAGLLRWIVIGEMTDSTGESYGGRGLPFLDFSGIGVSVGVTWAGW